MGKKTHKILDHRILGYFLLFIFAEVLCEVGSFIDLQAGSLIPGFVTEMGDFLGGTAKIAYGPGMALAALAALLIFKLWFRPEYKGCLHKEYLKEGLLMMLPFVLIHWAGSAVSWFAFGTGSVLIAFLRSFAPGFGEEAAFRGLGIANYMRTVRDEKQIPAIFWLSSLFFAVTHLGNILAGGDPAAVLFQFVYTIGVGMLLGAVYLRTANLWPGILVHMSLDFMEFIRADIGSAGGVMTGLGVGDWITMAAAAVGAVLALRLMAPKHYPEILEVWESRWSLVTGR